MTAAITIAAISQNIPIGSIVFIKLSVCAKFCEKITNIEAAENVEIILEKVFTNQRLLSFEKIQKAAIEQLKLNKTLPETPSQIIAQRIINSLAEIAHLSFGILG